MLSNANTKFVASLIAANKKWSEMELCVMQLVVLLLCVPTVYRYGSIFKGCLTLYAGKGGDIHKIGECV